MIEIVIYPNNSVHIDNGKMQFFAHWDEKRFSKLGIPSKRITHSIRRLETPVIKKIQNAIYIIFYGSAKSTVAYSGKRRGRKKSQRTIN
jgi:hypothetical protein